MLLEEMELDGADARRVPAPADATPRDAFPVVVIGCGESGLLAGIRLQEAGIPFTIVEKNAGVGGTWWENSLPGRPGRRRQPLLLLQLRAERPLDRVLRPAARAAGVLPGRDGASTASSRTSGWETEVLGAAWDDAHGHLVGAGPRAPTAPRTPSSPARSSPRSGSSTGRASPTSPGRTTFAGPVVPLGPLGPRRRPHRQAGRDDRRRRERVPDRARHRRRGRAPHRSSSAPRSGCSRTRTTTSPSGPGVRWALRHLPFYGRWYRFLLFWPGCDKGLEAGPGRPRLPRPAAGGQRDERLHPADVHRVDRRARSATTRTCSPRSCPTTRPPASARCRTTGAGCARSPATTSTWSAPASTTSSPTRSSPSTASATSAT